MNSAQAVQAPLDGTWLSPEDEMKLYLLEAALLNVCNQWGIAVRYSVPQGTIWVHVVLEENGTIYGLSLSGSIEIAEELDDDLPGRVAVLAHEVAHEFLLT
jgi:hypothetical protein